MNMEKENNQKPTTKEKPKIWKLALKFLVSVPVLWMAYVMFEAVFTEDTDEPILLTIWGIFFLLWGSSWALQIFGLDNTSVFVKAIESKTFKMTAKIVMWALIIFLAGALIVGAFNFIAGLSATTIIIILLVMIYTKLGAQDRTR